MISPFFRRRLAVWLPLLASTDMIVSSAVAAPKYESGVVANAQASATTWHTVTFATPFSAPPVVVLGTPTQADAQFITTRVRNVTATGFQYQLDEWDYLDGVHGAETLHYLALEPGSHTIGGLTWKAGRTSGITKTATTVAYGSAFSAAPVVLAQVESATNAKALTSRVRLVTTTNFELKLITEEADASTLTGESVGWIAITPGTGTIDGAAFQVAKTGATVTQAWTSILFSGTHRQPQFFAQAQTVNGTDPFALRRRNLGATSVEVFLEEEQSADAEVNHAAEEVGYLVFSESTGELRSKLDLVEVTQSQPTATTWHTETFPRTYSNPVVVFGPPTQNGGDPVRVRVRNVTSTGFQWQFDEWDYADGTHGSETVHYLVAEEGAYLIGGLRWQFGRTTGVTQAAGTKTFAEAFPAAPVVLGQVVTTNEAAAVVPRLNAITTTGFTVRLQEEEGANQTHAAEGVHYVAVEKGSGRIVTSQFVIEAAASAANVTQAFRTLNFSRKLADPFLLADSQTLNEVDPIVVRQRNLGPTKTDIRVQEETSAGSEVAHAGESIGTLVIAGALDLDEDGLPDAWETSVGLNPADPSDALLDGDGDGINNLNEYAYGTSPSTFDSGGVVTLTASISDGYEKEGIPARFTVSRTGGTVPVTVAYTLAGKASAGADYATTGSTVTIGFNATSADIVIEPVLDTTKEYPEDVVLTLSTGATYSLGGSTTASARINDATAIPANEELFVAFLGRQGSAQTYASGFATFHLNGPRNAARVNLSFSGLTSNQTNAYIRYGVASGVGPELRPTLPIGQVSNETWNIVPVGALTGQDIVDALYQAGGKWVYLNIGTGNYPAGEITGNLARQTGSSTFTPPPAPPAIATLTGDDLKRDVARFLTQATYGPTKAEIDALVNQVTTTHGGNRIAAYTAWIDAQLALDATSLLTYTEAADAHEWALRGSSPSNFTNNDEPRHNNRRRGWWTISTKAHDQLRQRLAFALSEIFVTSDELNIVRTRHYGLANYYDLLAQGADGSYRTLLENVSKSPIMGKYLSHLQNQKAILDGNGNVLVSPDENYAREILQLFSIGLVHRHLDGSLKLGPDGLPIQTYSNDDITNLARVFTGWSFSKKHGTAAQGYPVVDNTSFTQGNGPAYFQASWTNPLKNFPAFHDTGAKTVLGGSIAAGLNGQQDLTAALNIIFAHPNVAPFISHLLIQRLVTSNPSAGYVYRVAQKFENNGSGVRGDLKAVVKAILLDYEARSLDVVGNVGYGKPKEPIIRYTQLLRALGAYSDLPLSALSSYGYPAGQLNNFASGTTLLRYHNTDTRLGQTPQSAPSVFNWFLPGFSPGGAVAAAGLVAPEFQLSTETSVIQAINYHYTVAQVNNGQNVDALVGATVALDDNVRLDRTALETLYDSEITAGKTVPQALATVLDQLDLTLTAGSLKARYASAAAPNPRSIIIDSGASLAAGTATAVRVKELLYLLVTSPEFAVQK